MKVRVDRDEHVLRSVGDPPNGIVCMGALDGVATWLVDAGYVPGRHEGPGVTVEAKESADGMGPASTPIDPDALVAACESTVERQAIVLALNAYLGVALSQSVDGLEYEILRSHCDLALATREALERQGFLHREATS